MKVSSKKSDFQPIVLEIVIESEEEARALYAIFNYSPNTELLYPNASSDIIECIGHGYSTSHNNGEVISRGITYDQFYRSKKGS